MTTTSRTRTVVVALLGILAVLLSGCGSAGHASVPSTKADTPRTSATSWQGERHGLTLPETLTTELTHTIKPPSTAYRTAVVTLIGEAVAGRSGTAHGIGSVYLAPTATNGEQHLSLASLPAQSGTAPDAEVSLTASVAGVFTHVPATGFDVYLAAETDAGYAAGSGTVTLAVSVVWQP